MEVAHADLAKVSRVVLVDVGAVVVLATGHTATTGVLPVLADTTVSGRDVAAAVSEGLLAVFDHGAAGCDGWAGGCAVGVCAWISLICGWENVLLSRL